MEKKLEIGKKYFVQTVTFYYTGELTYIGKKEIGMKNVSWVADTGRFMQAIENGSLSEVEPIRIDDQEILIGRGAIIDVIPWKHELPKDQK